MTAHDLFYRDGIRAVAGASALAVYGAIVRAQMGEQAAALNGLRRVIDALG